MSIIEQWLASWPSILSMQELNSLLTLNYDGPMPDYT